MIIHKGDDTMLKIGTRVKCVKKSGKIFEGYIISKRKGHYTVMDIDDTMLAKEFNEDNVYYNGSGMAHDENTYLNINNVCLNILNRMTSSYEDYYSNMTEEEEYISND
jgi:hypothetical protein